VTFFVSDSLKDSVTEESLAKENNKNKSNILENIYAEITLKEKQIYCGVENVCFKSKKTIVILTIAQSSPLVGEVILSKEWENINIKVANFDNNLDTIIFSASSDIKVKKIQKSLSGYNYDITIVIDKAGN